MSLRVLHVYDTIDMPETYVIKELLAKGVQLDILARIDGCSYLDLLENEALDIEPINCRHRLDLRAILKIRRKLSSDSYDVVHMFTSRAIATTLFACTGIRNRPKTVAYRGAMGNVNPFDPTTLMTYRNPKVDAISCVSEEVRKYLASCKISSEKLHRIYKGHRLEWYQSAKRSTLAEFGIPEDAFVVACTANMRRGKGVDVLLQAAELLHMHKSFHFLLLGEARNPELKALREKSKLKDRIHFTGWRLDAPALVGACDILVQPTRRSEGLPKAVIEAMAQGIPAVGTRIGGTPELIEHEVSGFVVPPEDPKTMAERILSLAENPEMLASFKSAARERIRLHFTLDATVEQTIALYESLSGKQISDSSATRAPVAG